jgi:hypothetical protein
MAESNLMGERIGSTVSVLDLMGERIGSTVSVLDK